MQQTDPQPSREEQPPLPRPGETRRIVLHRRRATITHDTIGVRPARSAIVPPLIGVAAGALCIAGIVWGIVGGALPTALLALLLLLALILVPLSGITFVYALFGANVIFDRAKQSGSWQQGFLGMGIGTTELVPFWKIDHIVVAEAGAPEGVAGRRTEELSQWEAVLVKQSGTRLAIAGMTVPRQFVRGGIGPVRELAAAVAALTGVPLELPDLPESVAQPTPDADRAVDHPRRVRPPAARRRTRVRTRDRRDDT